MVMRNTKNISIELMRYLMIMAVVILHFGEDFTGEMRTLMGGHWEIEKEKMEGRPEYEQEKREEKAIYANRQTDIRQLSEARSLPERR